MTRRICLAAVLALTAACAVAAPAYDHLYAFGDSYSDNGASQAFSRTLVAQRVTDAQELPGPLYWEGRWSNGPTAVEGLAQALKVPLSDYAVGGAKSGQGNYYAWMASRDTGVSGQIAQYLDSAKSHKADPDALYFIFASANDFFEWADFSHPESIDQLGKSSVANLSKAAQTLIAAGAKHLMVVGTTDLTHVPAVVQGNQVSNAAAYQKVLEQQLPDAMKQLAQTHKVSISYFDHLAFSQKLRAAPQAVGLTDLENPCQVTYPEVKAACDNPDAHYYWDEWHPTRQVHAQLAKALFEGLEGAR